MRGAGKPRTAGRENLERDMEDRMTQMRLRLLEEKLEAERRSAASSVADSEDGSHRQLEAARSRQAELRDLLERERQLADRLQRQEQLPRQQRRNNGGSSPRHHRRGDDGRGDRFSQMMEMMMMQNSQMHNLMLNQMVAKNSAAQHQPPPPPPPLPPPPQPVFLPMPGYEGFTQQRSWGRPERADDDQRKKPTSAPDPKPTTPAEETPKAAKPESEDEEEQVPFPFPGNKSQQKLRRLAYTAFFLASLNRLTNENKFRPRFDFLFDVRLKEMLETLHRIYKTPDGPLYSVTFATVMGEEAVELTELMNVPKTLNKDEERVVVQELAYCIENTVFQVTDIMPTKGILGTHRKSGTFELIRSGNLFPKGYFYDIEKSTLEFDEDGRTDSVTDCNARMLLIGLFLMRALVETLYLKTEHYGMVVETTQKAERNIRLVATVLTYIYRKVVGQLTVMDQGTKKARVSVPDVPAELSGVMHTDQEIRPVLRVAKKSLDYAINLLMHWSEEYVKRLRDAGFT